MEVREREPIPVDALSEEQRQILELLNREGSEIKRAIDQLLVERKLSLQITRLSLAERAETGVASALPFDDVPPGGCYCNANGAWYCC
jgi:hypothetical protein